MDANGRMQIKQFPLVTLAQVLFVFKYYKFMNKKLYMHIFIKYIPIFGHVLRASHTLRAPHMMDSI